MEKFREPSYATTHPRATAFGSACVINEEFAIKGSRVAMNFTATTVATADARFYATGDATVDAGVDATADSRVDATPCAPNFRRAFIRSIAVCAATPSLLLNACASGAASPPSSPDATARDYRLANRVSWGATDAEYDRVRRLGERAYLDEQLHATATIGAPSELPAAAQAQIDALRIQQVTMVDLVRDHAARRKRAEALPAEDERKAALQAAQQDLNRLAREAATRHLLRALYSPNQLREQMTWFWFNHFNVHQHKHDIRAMLGDYEEHAIRPRALGRFRDLLGAIVHHPAMLRYLDNEHNAAGRINENFARELLELHTLGIDGGYAQRDVQELARVLTGHGVNLADDPGPARAHAAGTLRSGLYEFRPARHDNGDKTLLGRRVQAQGAAELEDVLDHLAAHPSTARFVSRKIARHLLSDEPPAAVVDAMAAEWSRGGGQIASVLGVLLRAPAFAAADTTRFKDPIHFVVSAVRTCYADRVVLNTQPMQNWLERLGEGLYNRQTPDGYPDGAAAWSSSGQMAVRFDIARALGSGSAGLFRVERAERAELPAFPQPARRLYYEIVRPLLGEPTRAALDGAASPQDWNTLFLSSPEFMVV
jgi:uncharacterized protein (DUF1800 family)